MNVEALRALEKAVEAGEFERGNGNPKKYVAFKRACDDAGVFPHLSVLESYNALLDGEAAELIRYLIAQAESKGVGE